MGIFDGFCRSGIFQTPAFCQKNLDLEGDCMIVTPIKPIDLLSPIS
jgi:hypothetical protein